MYYDFYYEKYLSFLLSIFTPAELLRESHLGWRGEEDRHIFETRNTTWGGDHIRLQIPIGGWEDSLFMWCSIVPWFFELKCFCVYQGRSRALLGAKSLYFVYSSSYKFKPKYTEFLSCCSKNISHKLFWFKKNKIPMYNLIYQRIWSWFGA